MPHPCASKGVLRNLGTPREQLAGAGNSVDSEPGQALIPVEGTAGELAGTVEPSTWGVHNIIGPPQCCRSCAIGHSLHVLLAKCSQPYCERKAMGQSGYEQSLGLDGSNPNSVTLSCDSVFLSLL